MCFKFFKNIFAAVFLLFTLMSIVATSTGKRGDDRPVSGTHYIISDCVNPVKEETVVVTSSAISSPGGMSFTDFGFPSATLSQTMTGTVSGVSRECTVTYGSTYSNDASARWLYSCFDNGAFKCSIYIEPK